ncbi:amino acid ABC transporter ATP-binding protein [Candidatus Aerophobetes bacterium]|nr:amino acid ABC transporter ATP-binding protein [Candidatus Aerophobetes bacterium]
MVEIKEVHKSFRDLHVLRGISMDVREGESVVIMGPSGSGKSTLLRCINYLEPIDAGSIRVDGELLTPKMSTRLAKLHKLRERIGFVFQRFNLFPHLTALDNVSLALKIVKKIGPEQAEEIAIRCLEQVGLKDKISSYPDQLSGGQQQRVAIARCLAMEPRLILLDEITSALDPELIKEVLEVLARVSRSGMTMIIITHELKFAKESADRICFFYNGKIIEEGAPEQIIESSQTAEAKRFFQALT